VKRKKTKARKKPLAVAPGAKSGNKPRIPWGLVAVLILATGSGLAAYQVVSYLGQSTLFGLKALEVEGLRLLDGDDVLAASGLVVGTNIFAVDLEEVERRLEQVCWIERALVVRKPPDRLAVEIVERRRAAWVELGTTYGIAHDGVLLPVNRAAGESADVLNLPVIAGLSTAGDSLWLGMAVPDSSLMAMLRWWGEATRVDGEFCLNVVRIEPLPGAGIMLQMADDLEVRLPLDRVDHRLRTLRRLMPRVYRDYAAPSYIDLRYSGQVIVGNGEVEPG
jgi:cell division septal protein FtsQ